MNNAALEAKGILGRKGFPESYDVGALRAALAAVRAGPADFPGYSHAIYDIDPALTRRIEAADVVVVEGLALHEGAASLGLDALIYLDADEAHLEGWFTERLIGLWRAAEHDPTSFYAQFRHFTEPEARAFAVRVWQAINLPNLREHIVQGPRRRRDRGEQGPRPRHPGGGRTLGGDASSVAVRAAIGYSASSGELPREGPAMTDAHVPHPRIAHRKAAGVHVTTDEHIGFNGWLAAGITKGFGSMWAFYVLVIWMFAWMFLATVGFWIFQYDKYPFTFLLFLSNLVQLLGAAGAGGGPAGALARLRQAGAADLPGRRGGAGADRRDPRAWSRSTIKLHAARIHELIEAEQSPHHQITACLAAAESEQATLGRASRLDRDPPLDAARPVGLEARRVDLEVRPVGELQARLRHPLAPDLAVRRLHLGVQVRRVGVEAEDQVGLRRDVDGLHALGDGRVRRHGDAAM